MEGSPRYCSLELSWEERRGRFSCLAQVRLKENTKFYTQRGVNIFIFYKFTNYLLFFIRILISMENLLVVLCYIGIDCIDSNCLRLSISDNYRLRFFLTFTFFLVFPMLKPPPPPPCGAPKGDGDGVGAWPNAPVPPNDVLACAPKPPFPPPKAGC